jgi:hypothetical protein
VFVRLAIAAVVVALAFADGVALSTFTSPVADASTGCGSYTPASLNQGSFKLVITQGDIGCGQARATFDDWFAGKGKQVARNGAEVGGYSCAGNPAGAFEDTGVLSFCDAHGVHFELQKP